MIVLGVKFCNLCLANTKVPKIIVQLKTDFRLSDPKTADLFVCIMLINYKYYKCSSGFQKHGFRKFLRKHFTIFASFFFLK